MLKQLAILILIELLLAACTAGPEVVQTTPATTTVVLVKDAPSPSATLRPAPSPTPSQTLAPTAPAIPSQFAVISSQNAEFVVQLAKILDDAGGIALSPDRKTMVTAENDGQVRLWDIREPTEPNLLWSLPSPTPFQQRTTTTSAAFSPNGQQIAIGTTEAQTVVQLDLRSLKFTVHDWPLAIVMSVTFSPDGNLLAAGGADGKVRIWHTATGDQLYEVQAHDYWVSSLAFSPQGDELASASSSDGLVKLWDMKATEPTSVFSDNRSFIYDLAFNPDGQFLLSGGCKVKMSTAVAICDEAILTVWNKSGGEPSRITGVALSTIFSVAVTPDGSLLAAGTEDGRIWLFDALSYTAQAILGGHTARVSHLQFSQDGQILASVGTDNAIRLWGIRAP